MSETINAQHKTTKEALNLFFVDSEREKKITRKYTTYKHYKIKSYKQSLLE